MSPNWVTKLSSILVITKFVIKYGDKFVTKFFTKQHHNPSSMKRAKRNGTHLPPPLPPPPLPPPPLPPRLPSTTPTAKMTTTTNTKSPRLLMAPF